MVIIKNIYKDFNPELSPKKMLKDNGHKKFIKWMIAQDIKVQAVGFMLTGNIIGKV